MHEEHEAELRVALAQGALGKHEVDVLREEAHRLARSPLELLRERGRFSEETLASLRVEAKGATPAPAQAPATSTSETPAFPVPGWERYQYVRFLGQGGMGRVFLAYDRRLLRNVALKFVRDDDAELARRFVAEARAQARVNHERICKVYEVGEVQGRPFIAMQYVEGQPLSALAPELAVEQKAILLRDAAEGVHEAHRVGLIHRDLKPSNLMVERTPDGGFRIYVMDFGLARDWKADVTATGAIVGTPHFMSPEQARGEVETLDRRADVYSLGATLYAVLTGQPPVSGSNGLNVLNKIAREEPRAPRSVAPNIPQDLEAIVLKCLEKDRSARYDSARALAQDLDRFLSGEPVLARPGPWYRVRKRLRKHRLAASLSAAALALVLVSLGWAGLTRREVALRERLASRFTERVERIEARARYSDLSPLHDTTADRKAIRANMDALEAEIREAGARAVGPGEYALGRGFLALGDNPEARQHLESAWQRGYREPRVAYALAQVLGSLYQERLREAERIQSPEQREARRREVERKYREPALAYLKQSEGAEVPSPDYVAALLAFHEGRLEDALALLDRLGETLTGFYEAPKLRGDILVARASKLRNQGNRDKALADFEAARRAYARAAAIGESVPAVYVALGELEYSAMHQELYGGGDVLPPYTRGLEAVSRALAAAPGHSDAKVLEARFRRRLAEYRTTQGANPEELLQQAREAAQSAVKAAPVRGAARLELSRVLFQWGRYLQDHGRDPREQLREALALAESAGPEDRDSEYFTHAGLIFATWAEYEELSGADSRANRRKAIEAYLAAVQLDAQVPSAWINLGTSYLLRASQPRSEDVDGDLKRAMDALDKAQRLNPRNVATYFSLARAHRLAAKRSRERGVDSRPELALALDLYRKGSELNPSLPQLHNGAGTALVEQALETWDRGGDPFPLLDQARAAFEQAISVSPKQGFAYNNVGWVLAQRAELQYERGEDPAPSVSAALGALRQAIELIPDRADPWANLGRVHSVEARFALDHGRDPQPSLSRASEALRSALQRNPSHAESWLYLGETRETRVRWQARRSPALAAELEEAEQAYEKAVALDPEDQHARIAFGHFCRERAAWEKETGRDPGGFIERGLGLADAVLAARPGWPDARLLRATLLAAKAEGAADPETRRRLWGNALEDFERALAANPNLARAWRSPREHEPR